MSTPSVAAFRALPHLLGAFEALHEHIQLDRSGAFVGGLPDDVPDAIARMEDALEAVAEAPFHAQLREAVQHLRQAEQALAKPAPDPSVAFLEQRREYARALWRLYPLRDQLEDLAPFWFLPSVLGERDALESPAPDADAPVGLLEVPARAGHNGGTLYVPESYTPSRRWPLIVALHGAYGRGEEYVFSWLRPAKSRRHLVLAPNASDVTWSILRPPRDTDAVLALRDEVAERYAIDPGRVLLTGLSDGGTFTYLAGLPNAASFSGLAPIAADFHPMMDPMLRRELGKTLPLLIVHGARDPIFPVRSIRSAVELMSHLEYNLRYEELPEWGHAYPYSIHERMVLPWFESLDS